MEVNPNLKGDDTKANSPLKFVEENAFGNPIILSEAPTTAAGQLKANQWGIYGTDLYYNIAGTTYKVSGSAV